MRNFEKISFEQFKKDIGDDPILYEEYQLPKRGTKNSSGYDFESLFDITLKPNEIKLIPLGIKANMNEDEILMILVRSSMGFKHNIRLTNQMGIIDSDYYNNPSNEGHIFIKIQNQGDKDFVINKKDKICQGIFSKYLTVDNEIFISNERTGGIGSTNSNQDV